MRKAIFGTVTTVAALVAVELALSLIGSPPRVHDPRFVLNPEWDYPEYIAKDHELFWRFRPDRVIESEFFAEGRYTINTRGFRSPEYAAPIPTGTRRVVCLGNSCTFGWRVADHAAYPRVLERKLQATGRVDWEVINAGVTGYSSLQGLRLLRRHIEEWRPDVVTICYGWNDHWRAAGGIADADLELPPAAIIGLQNLLSRMLIYRWLKYTLRGTIGRGETAPPTSVDDVVYRVSSVDYAANIRETIALCRESGAEVVLITAPIGEIDPANVGKLFGPAMAKFHARYNDALRHVAKENGVMLLDAAAAFETHETAALFDDSRSDPIHYNPNGHKLLADLLAKMLTAGAEKRTKP